jgi:hypothetical protein
MVRMERRQQSELPEQPGVAVLIVETDGSMMLVVETKEVTTKEPSVDLRENRKLDWKEGRPSLVHQSGSVTPVFSTTMGTVDDVGDHLFM